MMIAPAPPLTQPMARVRATDRVRVHGKFLFQGDEKLYVRGVTYGPFRPTADGEYGSPEGVHADFQAMVRAGVNAVRLYTMPPEWLLDLAAQHGLRVMLGAAWAQHLGFLEDRTLRRDSIERVTAVARACRRHPAILAYCIGNEIPASVVRWYGYRKVEAHLKRLYEASKSADPDTAVTYVNYPSTEYLELPFLDLVSFNVFLEDRAGLERYLSRIQNRVGDRPLILSEVGLDSIRNGLSTQAASIMWQVGTAFSRGCAGAFVFSWTDQWHRGGEDVTDWGFGLTDWQRRAKPALAAVQSCFDNAPCVDPQTLPKASVVVCSYNGGRTIGRCLESLSKLEYPDYEVIVINDGSNDATPAIAARFPCRLITTENRGLSAARNTGFAQAVGEIVAYIDDDASPDPHWLQYLATTLLEGHAGAGGPNLPVHTDGVTAACVTNTPGNPTHVLLSDTVAEHVPGCNMAFWKWALESVGGFDRQFRIAGDDVDLCWRLQDRDWTLGFSPAAQVWHHRRGSVRAFWRQQFNYGRAEADLERKWPEKYNAIGHARWSGRLYAAGYPPSLVPAKRRIYHGVWGMALFQHVYAPHRSMLWALPAMPEWHGIALVLGAVSLLGLAWEPLLLFTVPLIAMLLFAGAQAVLHALRAPIDRRFHGTRRLWMRVLTAFLYLMQPMARFVGRSRSGLTPWRLRGVSGFAWPFSDRVEHWSKTWRDPFRRLADLEAELREGGAVVIRGHEFAGWDLELRGGLIGQVRIRQFTSDLPHGVQLVRLDGHPRCAGLGVFLFALLIFICTAATHENQYLLAGTAWLGATALAILTLREVSAAMATFRRTVRRIQEA